MKSLLISSAKISVIIAIASIKLSIDFKHFI